MIKMFPPICNARMAVRAIVEVSKCNSEIEHAIITAIKTQKTAPLEYPYFVEQSWTLRKKEENAHRSGKSRLREPVAGARSPAGAVARTQFQALTASSALSSHHHALLVAVHCLRRPPCRDHYKRPLLHEA